MDKLKTIVHRGEKKELIDDTAQELENALLSSISLAQVDKMRSEYFEKILPDDGFQSSRISDLQRAEIEDLLFAKWFADQFDMNWLRDLVEDKMAMYRSINGKAVEQAASTLSGNQLSHGIRERLRMRLGMG